MSPDPVNHKVGEALTVLEAFGLPRAQLNERSALCLLALLDLTPDKHWRKASDPLIGITPIMDWVRLHYGRAYAPNTRETFRRQTMHQFCDAGLAVYNPDDPGRPTNSPLAVYQIGSHALKVLQSFGSRKWNALLTTFREQSGTLTQAYAKARDQQLVPVVCSAAELRLSPGAHSQLIRAIIEDFAPRFAPGSLLIYAGDTGEKFGYFDSNALRELGVTVDTHGKMPDVVLYFAKRGWLLLVESVTSHGPVDSKRHQELAHLFRTSSAGLVFVTAFPTRSGMTRYLSHIAWETEVWVAESPSHLIHFNGDRFLGPHSSES